MKLTEAIELINHNMAYREGWHFTASDASGYFTETTVVVSVKVDTVDTSYPDADGICRSVSATVGTSPFVLDVAGMDAAALCHAILKVAHGQIEEHESREFLKVRQPDGSWVAPLHPHTYEGEEAWNRYQLASMN